MKKITKLLSLIAVLFLVTLTLTSCGKTQGIEENKEEIKIDTIFSSEAINVAKLAKWIADGKKAEDFKKVEYLGFYDSVNGILYLEGAVVKAGSYQLVEKGAGLPPLELDGKGFFGPYFAGWYNTENLRADGNRLVTFNDFANDEDHIVYAYNIDFVQAIVVACICILIVFAMLMLLWGLVSLLKFVAPKQKEQPKPVAPVVVAAPVKKAISLEDIKDEDMMAAALVATIDYHEETKEDVRVVSIKEIK